MRKRSKGRTCRRSGQVALALLLCLGAAPASAAELYGLVVGIDDYIGTENDLDGAVNDAQDVAHSLNETGAKEVVRLLNDDASKDKITAAWEGLVNKAKAGDRLSSAMRVMAARSPARPDRHDKTHIESFLLGHFEPNGPGTPERIVDDEVFAWLQQAYKKGVKVDFVADSCHSGGMERSASAPGIKFRRMVYPVITHDELNFPPPETSKFTADDFQNITFVAAVPADKLVPEVTIDGKKRGALSWTVARAFEGRAARTTMVS